MTAVKKTQPKNSRKHRTSRPAKNVRKHSKRIQYARPVDGPPGNSGTGNG
jgi:hypothetical protein